MKRHPGGGVLPGDRVWLAYLALGLAATGVFFVIPQGIPRVALAATVGAVAVVSLLVLRARIEEFAAMRRVTWERAAVEALRESEERFRAAFDGAPMGLAIVAIDGTVLRVNAALCDLTGYSVEELEGRHFSQFVPAAELGLDPTDLRGIVANGEVRQHLERRILGKGGVEHWCQMGVSLLHDESGEPNAVVVQALDITARKIAEAERERADELLKTQNVRLEEANRIKDELISVVSHDLRTPLTSIMGYLEIVLDEDDGPLTAEQRRFLEVINRNADRLLALVNDLLLVSRVDAGKFVLELAEADLEDVIAEVVEAQRPAATRAGVDLRLVGGPVRANVDRVRITEALENLLSNALKFTSRGGAVEVGVGRQDGVALIWVADTGIGITPDDQRHLFERFFRSSRTRHVQGIGLGLVIVKAIVEAHGGRIGVESRPDEGTTFRVELPLASGSPVNERASGVNAGRGSGTASAL